MSDDAIELVDLGRGSARALGERHAEAWGERAAALFGVRWRLLRARSRVRDDAQLRALADAHLPVLHDFHPPAVEELEGFAHVSGLEPWQLVVLNHYTDFRDIPPESGGCSVVYAPLSEGPFAAQTWDMHGTAEAFVGALRLKRDNTPAMALFTLAGCVGMTGLNTAGVSVCINNLTPSDARVGVVWPSLVRRMLEERSAEAAVEVLRGARLGSGHNYMVADERAVFNVETTGRQQRVTHADAHGWYWHTNHYLHPELQPLEMPRLPTSTTCDRYDRLEQHLGPNALHPRDARSLWQLLGSHEGFPRSLCTHLTGDDPSASKTCGGVVCDLRGRRMLARRGCLNDAAARTIEVTEYDA